MNIPDSTYLQSFQSSVFAGPFSENMLNMQYVLNQVAVSFKGVLGSYYDSGPTSDDQIIKNKMKTPQQVNNSEKKTNKGDDNSVSISSGRMSSTSGSSTDSDDIMEPEFTMVNPSDSPLLGTETDAMSKILNAVSESTEVELGVTFCPLPDDDDDTAIDIKNSTTTNNEFL